MSSLLKPGDVIADGRFELVEVLGRGATAVVYKAEDTRLGVDRAIKVLTVAPSVRYALRARLEAEARAMSKLDHPNVLQVMDIGETRENTYVVMRLAEGGSLADRLDQHGPMPPREALGYMLQVLWALAAAHSAGIIHRDVKPQNVLIDKQGTALLCDFGIAMLSEEATRMTRTGVAMGSLAFMAPEQRLDARSVGPTADIYAVATSLYNLLTGSNPMDLFAAGPDSPRWYGVDSALQELMRTGCRYEPDDRYPTAQAMADKVVEVMESASETPISIDPLAIGVERLISSNARVSRPAIPPSQAATSAAIDGLSKGVETVLPSRDAPGAVGVRPGDLPETDFGTGQPDGRVWEPDTDLPDGWVRTTGVGEAGQAPRSPTGTSSETWMAEDVPAPVPPPRPPEAWESGVMVRPEVPATTDGTLHDPPLEPDDAEAQAPPTRWPWLLLAGAALLGVAAWTMLPPGATGVDGRGPGGAIQARVEPVNGSGEVAAVDGATEGEEGAADPNATGTDATGTDDAGTDDAGTDDAGTGAVPTGVGSAADTPTAAASAGSDRPEQEASGNPAASQGSAVAPAAAEPAGDPMAMPLGTWQVNSNGMLGTLRLTGSPARLRGQMKTQFMGNTIETQLAGAFDAASGRLQLKDTQESWDQATYSLTWNAASAQFEGQSSTGDGPGSKTKRMTLSGRK